MIDMGAPEIMWAMEMTDNNNLGGSTQFNFWYNQDTSYGEGYNDGPIYSFLNFLRFATNMWISSRIPMTATCSGNAPEMSIRR